MAITTDWQAYLVERDLTLGRSTNYPGIGGISGIGLPEPRVADLDGMGDGSHLGADRYLARTILLPTTVVGDTSALIWENYRALADGWRISRTAELELQVRLPGSTPTVRSFFGRPRGLQPAALGGLKGAYPTVATFRCGDPFAYGAEVDTGTDSSSPLTITAANLGDQDTDRAVLTIVGNGGTPTITNTTTGGVVDFDTVLAGAAVATVDLHTRAVTVGGSPAPGVIDPASTWFDLAADVNNVLTFTGAASLQVEYRPAWSTA